MPLTILPSRSFFRWIVNHPKRVIIVSLLLMVSMLVFIPQLGKDTRADAFLADDNPALVYRGKVKDLFGLSDPLVIAVVSDRTIFTPEALNFVKAVTEAVALVDNIDPEGIILKTAVEHRIWAER
ncbi:MAG: hypothetical protein AAFZ92_07140 [Pseudomonadota bacterium]